jgi:hypothetical protein
VASPPLARNFWHRQKPRRIEFSPEEFEQLRQSVYAFVTTDKYGNPTRPPEWVKAPPDDAITWEIAETGCWNLPAINAELLRLKRAGKKAEISYAFFVWLIRAEIGNRYPGSRRDAAHRASAH